MSEGSPFKDAYDPATMPASSLGSVRAVWYRRPWFLITATIVLVVGLSIISDLPHPMSKADDAKAQLASVKEINTDLKPCVYAIKESFDFYRRSVAGALTSDEKRIVKSYLVNDVNTCSGASGQTDQLVNSIQIVQTNAGKQIGKLLYSVETWVIIDAYHAILDIQTLVEQPHDAAALKDLAKEQGLLTQVRQSAFASVDAANAILGSQIPYPILPLLAPLPSA
ncbi:MAG TPA: hypothetical protein VMU98_05250 [Acidimicrobiales bacterium]|nr:hypothetical protein [Acidimicrobiales bacterium]